MQLHILNGDSSLYTFQRAGLTGDTIVWRETLSEGPVSADLSYEDLFTLRARWFSQTSGNDAEYQTKVISELNRLQNYSRAEDVTLWFEFDLHCQINLIFLLSFFNSIGHISTLSLICPASHPNHPDFRGIGELSAAEFAELPQQKVTLDQTDLRIAAAAWRAYCSGDPATIEHFISQDHHHLVSLKPALQAHLNRFPDENTGLTKIEQELAEIMNKGLTDRAKIYHEFWKSNAIYGMGDQQIDLYIDNLLKISRTAGFSTR